MRLHLLDGTFELFRAHHSPRPRRYAPDGTDVTAAVGLAYSVAALLDDEHEQPTHLGVAFDRPIESFRNELFDGYKDGSDVDPVLLAQFELAERGVAALGVHVWVAVEVEADDVLASAARRFSAEVEQVRVLSPDKDLGACVGAGVVQVDRPRERVLDAAGVRERLGVPPPAVADLLALEGDAADGIPGVPGIGRTTAGALLRRYGSIDEIPDDPGDWDVTVRGAARVATALREHADELRLWRRLARLRTDVGLRADLDDLRWTGPTPDLEEFCERTGAGRLRSLPERRP